MQLTIELVRVLPAPLRIKAWPAETVYSFASRLERRLKAHPRVISHLAYADITRTIGRRATPGKTTQRMVTLCEIMCGVPAGTLTTPSSILPFSSHHCSDCVGGCAVEYEWTRGRYTCELHRRWIAPCPSQPRPSTYEPHPVGPAAQERVGLDVVDADLRIEALLAEGRGTTRLLDEITRRIDSMRGQEHHAVPRPGDLPLLATVLSVVTDPAVQAAVLDETVSFAERYARLATVLEDGLTDDSPELCDQVWLLLRPTAVWVRTTFLRQAQVDAFEPFVMPDSTVDFSTARYPLDPFQRSMDCLRTVGRQDHLWWNDRYMLAPPLKGSAPLLICDNGHVQSKPKGKARNSASEEFHCAVCCGKRVVAGLNSLGDLMPILVPEWNRAVNGALTPFMVLPGSNQRVAWTCSNGHNYPATVIARALRGTQCKYCAGALLPGRNDFATTHPELAALWDCEENGNLKPAEITAGNTRIMVHLRCRNGHSMVHTPAYFVTSAGRCQTCLGTTLVAGTNDLATRRPDVAVWWHPAKNGDLTPDMVKPGSDVVVWWLCADGHAFPAPVSHRCRYTKRTCLYDTGRVLRTGVNDVATKEPDLVKDWDSTLNPKKPTETVPTDNEWWWTCRFGHTQHTTVANRHKSGGCTQCPPEDRVGQPRGKFNRGRNGWDNGRLNPTSPELESCLRKARGAQLPRR